MSTAPHWFRDFISMHDRVAIVGGPRSGKTTLAASVTDRPVFGTDDLMALPWEDVPRAVIEKAETLGSRWVIEGVQVARSLRKGLCPDAVLVLRGSHGGLTPGQSAMSKGIDSVLREWHGVNRSAIVRVVHL
jgi:hypothetical protein